MNNIEGLQKQIGAIQIGMEVLMRACAEQQSATLQMIAHIDTANAALRELLSRATGEDKSKLRQRQVQSFDASLKLLSEKYEAWKKQAASGVPLYLPPDPRGDIDKN